MRFMDRGLGCRIGIWGSGIEGLSLVVMGFLLGCLWFLGSELSDVSLGVRL